MRLLFHYPNILANLMKNYFCVFNSFVLFACIILVACQADTKPSSQQLTQKQADDMFEKAKQFYQSSQTNAQSRDSCAFYLSQLVPYYESAKDSNKLLSVYSIQSAVNMLKNDFRKCLMYVHKTELLWNQIQGEKDTMSYFRSNLVGVTIYTELFDYEAAYKCSRTLERIMTNLSPGALNVYYNNVGILDMKALQTFQRRIAFLSDISLPKINLPDSKSGESMEEQDSLFLEKKSHLNLHKGLSMRMLGAPEYVISESYNNLAAFFIENEWNGRVNVDSAIHYINKCMAIREPLFEHYRQYKDSVANYANGMAECYYHFAEVYRKKGQAQQAIDYYRKSMALYQEYKLANPFYPDFYGMAKAFETLSQYDSVWVYCNRAFEIYDTTKSYDKPWDMPSAFHLNIGEDRLMLVELLLTKLAALQQMRHTDSQHDLHVFDAYVAVSHVFDSLQHITIDPSVQFVLRGKRHEVQSQLLNVAYTIYQKTKEMAILEKAFNAGEATFAGSLENNRQKVVSAQYGLPDSLALQERVLQREIISFSDSSYLRYEAFLQKIRKLYPNYYLSKYPNPLEFSQIASSLLEKDQALIQYFLGDNQLSIFAISANHAPIWKTVSIQNDTLTQWIKNIHQTNMDAKAAHQLFQLLFPAEIYTALPPRLLIIRDGLLHHIPFDALLTKPYNGDKSHKEQSYLLNEKTLAFTYSATFQFTLQSQSLADIPATWFGVAPPTNLDNQADIQLYAKKGWADTLLLLGEAASPERFQENIVKAGVAHLSTHAIASGNNPYFDFGKMIRFTMKQIYQLRMNVLLFVADACGTADGLLYKGKELQSIESALLGSGAMSVVATKWEIKESDSRDILQLFYANLQKGNTKDVALAAAKRDYLNSHATKTPIHWASFELTGDTRPIPSRFWKQETSRYIWVISGIVLLAVLYMIYRWKRR